MMAAIPHAVRYWCLLVSLFVVAQHSVVAAMRIVREECDYTQGNWVHAAAGTHELTYDPLSCHVDTEWVCPRNKATLEWTWQLTDQRCDHATAEEKVAWFGDYFSSHSILFVGDSLARNMYQSMVCLLTASGEEASGKVHFINSDFLAEEHDGTVYVDRVDPKWAAHVNEYDVVVIQFGHWYAHPGVAYWKGNGTAQLANVPPGRLNTVAFSSSANIALGALVREGFSGRTVLSTYSPSHFHDGDYFDKEAHCNFTKPDATLALWQDPVHSTSLSDAQESVRVVYEAADAHSAGGKLDVTVLDLMGLSRQRPDAHPGRANSKTDCAHWCLPGVPDTWNKMLYFHLTGRPRAASHKPVHARA
mmetsp:Transcript_15240/g.44592  ORF Transcript_15240/g.44592 Transcript_15240/m.44592 type:complete len:361 (-) Transcript_15240:164-1246(-)